MKNKMVKNKNHNELEKNRGDYLPDLRMGKAFQIIKEKVENTKSDRFDCRNFKTSVWKKKMKI